MRQTSTMPCNILPRKRRRGFSELHSLLTIFIFSSSCMIIGSLEAVAAKAMEDYGSVTTKGENVFMAATSGKTNNDDDLGNVLSYDLPAKTQVEEDEGDDFGGASNDAGDDNVRNEHATSEDLGMMQTRLEQAPVKDVILSNRRLRYQQIHHALRESATSLPLQQQKPQHRHFHEHHYNQRHKFGRPDELKRAPHHYSMHTNHQDYVHQHSGYNFSSTLSGMTTSTTTTMRPRYFDRDGLYTDHLSWVPSTKGPLHLEKHKLLPKMIQYSSHKRLSNDDDKDKEITMEKENAIENEFKRISLPLDTNRVPTRNDKLYEISTFDTDNKEDDDYNYDDDEENNSTPPLASTPKANVKRYTDLSRSSHKSSAHSEANNRQNFAMYSMASTNGDYDDGTSSALSDEDDDFSEEKWNKIEHEHYRKQMQHQQVMQALRSRRPSSAATTPQLDNTSNSITKSVRFTSTATGSLKSATSAKRQPLNDDDMDNIYSRYYVPGLVTRMKEEEVGSPTAMLDSRRQYAMQQRQNKAFASAHHRRVVKDGSCRLPQPRIERIRRDSWKIYTPHCTILHRCADDTGCCPTERQTCAPKRTKNVDLYFFVISLNETQGSIEHLTFVNHTECHCVDKSKQQPPEYATEELVSGTVDLSSNHIPFLRRATILNCNCPNLYEKILQEDGFCRCDCSSGNMGCGWLKRGMEHFSMNDRKCISEGRCKLPTCEYGAYMKKHGRCPRREERQLAADTVDW